MAIRTPLKIDSTDLQVMAAADTTALANRAAYLYSTDPSVNISFGAAADGTFTTLVDTRMKAGAMSTDVTNFDLEAETAEPTTVSVSYTSMAESVVAGLVTVADTASKKFPVYLDASNDIQAMTLQDMYDSFIHGALDTVIAGQPFKSWNVWDTAPAGYTQVAVYPIFTDTIADLSLYTAAEIGETLDQPETLKLWQLWQKDAVVSAYGSRPLYIDGSNNLVEYTEAEFDAILLALIRYAAVNLTSHKIRYFINGTGTTCGQTMTDTALNGTGNYQTLAVGLDDYRAQEFPDGVPVVVSTYNLKVRKV
jgi:hypothetical protein|tara:strand:+ start:1790 stop:2713 length:924 start_codon:yes stop_codon:yes gene_type:complete